METITLRVRRGSAFEVSQLALCGHRLLGGHADTGVFQIVANELPRATPAVTPARFARRSDDDGLSTATIEITEPLAFAESASCNDPYNRGVSKRR